MAGEGVSSLILLTASIIVALIVASAIFFVAFHFRDSMESRERLEEQYLKTKIEIVNDLYYSPYNGTTGNITIYVKNIGRTVLNMNHTIVMLNGTAYPVNFPDSIFPLNGDVWAPQVTVKITVHVGALASGDYLISVVVDYGVRDTMKFRV